MNLDFGKKILSQLAAAKKGQVDLSSVKGIDKLAKELDALEKLVDSYKKEAVALKKKQEKIIDAMKKTNKNVDKYFKPVMKMMDSSHPETKKFGNVVKSILTGAEFQTTPAKKPMFAKPLEIKD